MTTNNKIPKMYDLEPYFAAGINPQTGLPIKLGGDTVNYIQKAEIKKQLRILDEQNAVNRFTWYNLPSGLNSRLMERILYYRGQGMFFKLQDKFYFLPYALDGSIDVYGRFTDVTPLPFNGKSSTDGKDKPLITGLKRKCLYEIEGAKAALALEKPERRAHSLRVAELAAARGVKLGISEKKAIQAALFHDCAKNLTADSPYLDGFVLEKEWGEVPQEVRHQYAGAYVAEKHFGITDKEVLDAIRYHTSGRPNMCELGKLIFLSDMLEAARSYKGVDELRALFWQGNSVDACLEEALYQTLLFLQTKKSKIYPLTEAAYEYMRDGKGTEV